MVAYSNVASKLYPSKTKKAARQKAVRSNPRFFSTLTLIFVTSLDVSNLWAAEATRDLQIRIRDSSVPQPAAERKGTNWQRLDQLTTTHQLPMTATTPLQIYSSKQVYKVGDLLESQIILPHYGKGYLNIVQVDSRDEVTVLFPNRFHQDSQINMQPGPLDINKSLNGFNIRAASDPLGDVLLLAFVTSAPLNLYQSSDAKRNATGELLDTVVQASQQGIQQLTRAFVVEEYADDKSQTGKRMMKTDFSYLGKLKVVIE